MKTSSPFCRDLLITSKRVSIIQAGGFPETSHEHFQNQDISGVGCRVRPSGGPDHWVRAISVIFRSSGEYFPIGQTINPWNGLLSTGATFSGIGEGELPDKISVENMTTLEAAQRLISKGCRPAVLSFASATNPGGGFLGGARAQEEYLARSSGLYACIRDNAMCAFHRSRRDPFTRITQSILLMCRYFARMMEAFSMNHTQSESSRARQ